MRSRSPSAHGSAGTLGDIGIHLLDFARGADMQAVLDACHESAAKDTTVKIHNA